MTNGTRTVAKLLARLAACGALVVLCSSCASVVAGTRGVLAHKRSGYPAGDTVFWDSMKPAKETVTIRSKPDHASVEVYDRQGRLVTRDMTPAVISLDKGVSYFRGARYRVTVEKTGYGPRTVTIRSWPDLPWYLAGNFVVGGAVGWLIADPYTGAMWNLVPSKIDLDLRMAGLEDVLRSEPAKEGASPLGVSGSNPETPSKAKTKAARKPAPARATDDTTRTEEPKVDSALSDEGAAVPDEADKLRLPTLEELKAFLPEIFAVTNAPSGAPATKALHE